jgi:hypothetical protein
MLPPQIDSSCMICKKKLIKEKTYIFIKFFIDNKEQLQADFL